MDEHDQHGDLDVLIAEFRAVHCTTVVSHRRAIARERLARRLPEFFSRYVELEERAKAFEGIPLDGPGSHKWDLAEMRAQTRRADELETLLHRALAALGACDPRLSGEICAALVRQGYPTSRPSNTEQRIRELEELLETAERGHAEEDGLRQLAQQHAAAAEERFLELGKALRDIFSIAEDGAAGTNLLGSIRNRVRETGVLAPRQCATR